MARCAGSIPRWSRPPRGWAPRLARSSGAIYLPLTLPGIFAGAVLVFVLSLGFFITPALLGGGRVMMIAVLIEQQVRRDPELAVSPPRSRPCCWRLTLGVYALAQVFTPAGRRNDEPRACSWSPAR